MITPPIATPWGKRYADAMQLAEGIFVVSTPSHGGVWLSPERFAQVPASVRQTPYSKGGWYEEDTDCLIPYIVFYSVIDAAYTARGAKQSHTRDQMIEHLRNFAKPFRPTEPPYWTPEQVQTIIDTDISAEADTPLPALDTVRAEERPTPLVAEPPPFTLTAQVSTAAEHQPGLFNGPPCDCVEPPNHDNGFTHDADCPQRYRNRRTPAGWQSIDTSTEEAK